MNPASLFLRKLTTDPVEVEGHGGGLKRSLGALDLTLLGIGAIIGAGLFSSIQDMIGGTFDPIDHSVKTLGAGPAVMISFALTGIACGFAALCYAEISAMVPVSGSAYSYSYAAFGELIAWIIGWDLIIEYAIGNVYVAQKWGAYFQTFLKGLFDWHFPLWCSVDMQTASGMAHSAGNEAWMIWKPVLGIGDGAAFDPASYFPTIAGHPIGINLPAFLITMLITTLLFVGIKESARANAVMVVLKVGLVLAFIGCGFWTIVKKGEQHWTPFMPNGFTGIWHGAAIGFFSYIGFDAVSTAGEETRNPQRDMPRGLLWSLGVCTLLYILTAVALTGVVDYNTIKTDDPLAAAMTRMGFDKFATLFAFGAVIAMTAVLLVFQLGQTRIFMVMSRDGLLPSVFSRIHGRFKTPHVSTWLTGMVVALACSILTPDQAIGLTNIGTLFAFILVSIGVIVLRRRHPDTPRPFKVPLYPLTPILSALACLALIGGLERSNWIRLLIWLQVGFVIYAWYGFRSSRLRRERSAEPARRAPLAAALVGWALVAAALWLDVQIIQDQTPRVDGSAVQTELFIAFYGLRALALEVVGLALILGVRQARTWFYVAVPVVLVASGWLGRTESWTFIGACALVAAVFGALISRKPVKEFLAA